MSGNPVLDLYRNAVARGVAPTNRELEAAFAAYADPEERGMYGRSRSAVIAEFGFGLPTAEVVARIVEHGPILEVGAGNGLWSFFLSEAGCDVVAVDLAVGDYERGLGVGRYHPVVRMDAAEAVRAYPERAVLLVWPDRANDVGERVADALEVGGTLLYMGEDANGCTGTPGFHDRLGECFDVLGKAHPAVWRGMGDRLTILRKEREWAPAASFRP